MTNLILFIIGYVLLVLLGLQFVSRRSRKKPPRETVIRPSNVVTLRKDPVDD